MPKFKDILDVKPIYWETEEDGKKLMAKILANEGDLTEGKYYNPENIAKYYGSALGAFLLGAYDYAKKRYIDKEETDKYKHAYLNCRASQLGAGGYDLMEYFAAVFLGVLDNAEISTFFDFKYEIRQAKIASSPKFPKPIYPDIKTFFDFLAIVFLIQFFNFI